MREVKRERTGWSPREGRKEGEIGRWCLESRGDTEGIRREGRRVEEREEEKASEWDEREW